MHAVIPYVIAALLFGLGVYGVLRRRNAVLVLMAVELMLNAVNLILVTADATTVRNTLVGVQVEAWAQQPGPPYSGGVFALFVVVLAAAEIGVGLAIVLQFYRLRASVQVTDVALDPISGPPTAGSDDLAEADVAVADRAAADRAAADVAAERVSG